jgi:transcriptional regulator with XRE-family HTH domain
VKDVGQRVETQRKSLGLSIRELEDSSGVSAATINRIVNGNPKVKAEKRAAVIRALEDAAVKKALTRHLAGAGDLADQIEGHAQALLELARQLRGANGSPASTPPANLPATRK